MATSTCLSFSSESSSSSESDDEQIEVVNYSFQHNTLSKVLRDLSKEELVIRSSTGHQSILLSEALLSSITAKEVVAFSNTVDEKLKSCLKSSSKNKISFSKVWRNFHVLRLSTNLKMKWEACVNSLNLTDDIVHVSDIVLQLILKRMMSCIIRELTSTNSPPAAAVQVVAPSVRELNIIRYIAGYVVLKLKKKFPEYSTFLNDNIVDSTFNYFRVNTIL